jgi:hypothetical protein
MGPINGQRLNWLHALHGHWQGHSTGQPRQTRAITAWAFSQLALNAVKGVCARTASCRVSVLPLWCSWHLGMVNHALHASSLHGGVPRFAHRRNVCTMPPTMICMRGAGCTSRKARCFKPLTTKTSLRCALPSSRPRPQGRWVHTKITVVPTHAASFAACKPYHTTDNVAVRQRHSHRVVV